MPERNMERRKQTLVASLVLALACITAPGWSLASPPQDTAGHDYDVQDARLNSAYQKLAAALDDAQKKQLRDEERQWIASRDLACGKGTAGAVVKNACSVASTSKRADELEQRLASAPNSHFSGSYGYRSDCNDGHYVQFQVEKSAPDISGTWSDGTRSEGDSGQFRGHLRDGKLYVAFCTDEDKKGFAQCPSFSSDDDAYFVQSGTSITWFQPVGTGAGKTFEKYVVLQRVKPGAKAPLDSKCSADH
jgi:uncharacterized protein YecT (DUF1311 family)